MQTTNPQSPLQHGTPRPLPFREYGVYYWGAMFVLPLIPYCSTATAQGMRYIDLLLCVTALVVLAAFEIHAKRAGRTTPLAAFFERLVPQRIAIVERFVPRNAGASEEQSRRAEAMRFKVQDALKVVGNVVGIIVCVLAFLVVVAGGVILYIASHWKC